MATKAEAQRSLEQAKSVGDAQAELAALASLLPFQMSERNHNQAIANLERQVTLTANKAKQQAALLSQEAELLLEIHLPRKALLTANRALGLQAGGSAADQARALHAKVQAQLATGKVEEGLQQAEGNRAFFRKAGLKVEEGKALLAICQLQAAAGEEGAAAEAARAAAELFVEAKAQDEVYSAVRLRWDLLRLAGKPAEAAGLAEEACKGLEGLALAKTQLLVVGAKVEVLSSESEAGTEHAWAAVLRLANSAARAAREGGAAAVQAEALCSVAQVRIYSGRAAEAGKAARDAAALYEKQKNAGGTATALILQAASLLVTGHPQAAVKAAHEALAQFTKAGDAAGAAVAKGVLGRAQQASLDAPDEDTCLGKDQEAVRATVLDIVRAAVGNEALAGEDQLKGLITSTSAIVITHAVHERVPRLPLTFALATEHGTAHEIADFVSEKLRIK